MQYVVSRILFERRLATEGPRCPPIWTAARVGGYSYRTLYSNCSCTL